MRLERKDKEEMEKNEGLITIETHVGHPEIKISYCCKCEGVLPIGWTHNKCSECLDETFRAGVGK